MNLANDAMWKALEDCGQDIELPIICSDCQRDELQTCLCGIEIEEIEEINIGNLQPVYSCPEIPKPGFVCPSIRQLFGLSRDVVLLTLWAVLTLSTVALIIDSALCVLNWYSTPEIVSESVSGYTVDYVPETDMECREFYGF